MYAIIDSNFNVIEASICKIKLEDKLADKLFSTAHDFGRQAADKKMNEFETFDIDAEADSIIDMAYQDAYEYKFNEINDSFKIVKWDSKQAVWI
ncbi:hypothetical protein [Acinetobacter baumannii]|uniref:hypothetical protein n=1 Tax=Acinetobacter baumannii TaxID=470 RepID=UPI0037005CB1